VRIYEESRVFATIPDRPALMDAYAALELAVPGFFARQTARE